MKKGKKIILWVIIFIIIVGLFGIGIFFLNQNEKTSNIQEVDSSTGVIKEVILPNGVRLTNGAITKKDGKYYIEMISTNETDEEVNMAGYRLSFRDLDNQEIEFFSGNVIGKLNASESRTFAIESYEDLSKISKIVYEVFFGEQK